MKLSILHQFPDFQRTIFFNLLRQESHSDLELVSPSKADLVIYGPFSRFPKIKGRIVTRKAVTAPRHIKRRGYQPLNVFHTIEDARHNDRYDYTIGYDFPTNSTQYRLPYWMESLDWSHEGLERDPPLRISRYFQIQELQRPLGNYLKDRNGQCAGFFGQIREPRKTLTRAVSSSVSFQGFGPAFDPTIRNSQLSGVFKDEILSDFSYNLCPENGLYPGYYTEKTLEAFASGCLPLTWADQNICKDFNPSAFVNLLDYASDGYVNWMEALNTQEKVSMFQGSELLRHTPSIEACRNFVQKILADLK